MCPSSFIGLVYPSSAHRRRPGLRCVSAPLYRPIFVVIMLCTYFFSVMKLNECIISLVSARAPRKSASISCCPFLAYLPRATRAGCVIKHIILRM